MSDAVTTAAATGAAGACWYLARPDAPPIFRSGRPFGDATASGGDDGLALPRPVTLAGGVRAAWADAADYFSAPQAALANDLHGNLRAGLEVCGPLVGELTDAGTVSPLAPVPADALRHRRDFDGCAMWSALQPTELATGEGTSLRHGLWPLISEVEPDDAMDAASPCWSWQALVDWLADDRTAPRQETTALARRGFATDLRTHHERDAGTGTAKDHTLHQSPGLDGAPDDWFDPEPFHAPHRLVFLARLRGSSPFAPDRIDRTVRRLGADGPSPRYLLVNDDGARPGCGDGRPARYAWAAGRRPDTCPEVIRERLDGLVKGQCFRLVLMTPGVFRGGGLPAFLSQVDAKGRCCGRLPELDGLAGPAVVLRAAALPRWAPHAAQRMAADASGRKAGVQAIRRIAAAGTVYWLQLAEDLNGYRLSSLWFKSVADTADATDGWGIAVPGVARQLTKALKGEAAPAPVDLEDDADRRAP